jgi:2-polyprenyl-3-methyl-5-hydroxy-6-metoxy-1,4-benzoquinol methylase
MAIRAYDRTGKNFTDYVDSIYGRSNILSPEEYESTSNIYHVYYGNFLPGDLHVPILDIGCGAGHFLYYLKKKGYRNFTGIDLSPDNIELCKRNVTPTVQLADAFEYLLKKKSIYSVISANDVLEHIPKERVIELLELIYRTLKPGGILLLRIPNMSNPFSIQMRYRDFTHECGFTEKSIYQVLYIAGFRDIMINTSWTDKESIKSHIRKIVFRKLFWFLGGCNAPEILSSLLIVIAKK